MENTMVPHLISDFGTNVGPVYKVEGAKTNTPPKTNSYKRLPITNTLLPWSVPHGVGVYGPMEWRF